MTKMLPILLIAVTALITTAIVQTVYGFLYLWQSVVGSTAPSYNWFGSLSASAIATAVVLLASVLALRLLAGKATIAAGPAGTPISPTLY